MGEREHTQAEENFDATTRAALERIKKAKDDDDGYWRLRGWKDGSEEAERLAYADENDGCFVPKTHHLGLRTRRASSDGDFVTPQGTFGSRVCPESSPLTGLAAVVWTTGGATRRSSDTSRFRHLAIDAVSSTRMPAQ